MSRLNKNYWKPGTPLVARDVAAWQASGKLSTSTVIKSSAGLLGGIQVVQTDTGGDVVVEVYDSDTSTTTDDEILAVVTVTGTTANDQNSFGAPSMEGVEAINGIYVKIAAGDAYFIAYYK